MNNDAFEDKQNAANEKQFCFSTTAVWWKKARIRLENSRIPKSSCHHSGDSVPVSSPHTEWATHAGRSPGLRIIALSLWSSRDFLSDTFRASYRSQLRGQPRLKT